MPRSIEDLVFSSFEIAGDQQWFDRLGSTIALINGIDTSKFAKLVARIMDGLEQCSSNVFTEEERTKLKAVFGLNNIEDVNSLVESVEYFLRQSIFHAIKPKILTKELTDLGLDTDKVVAFVDLWSNNGSKLIDSFKAKSFEISSTRLTETKSCLKLLAQHNSSQQSTVTPLAQIDLTLKTSKNSTNLSLDLDQKELWQLYENLEHIQSQLDALHK